MLSTLHEAPFDPAPAPPCLTHYSAQLTCPASPGEEMATPLKHFEVIMLDRLGAPLAKPRVFTFDCRNRTAIEELVYWRSGSSGPELLVESGILPASLARHKFPGFASQDAARPTLQLARLAAGTTRGATLGGRFSPSVGGSIECCYLKLNRAGTVEQFGAKFYLSPQRALEEYRSGNLRDLRTLLAGCRLAEKGGIKLALSGLPAPSTDGALSPETRSRIPQILDQKAALGWLASEAPEGRVSRIAIRPTNIPPQPFMTAESFEAPEASGDGASGIPGSPPRQITLSKRRGLDAVDVAAYCWRNRELYMFVKRELRPALAAARIMSGEAPGVYRATSLGGVAESLEGESSIEEVAERGAQGVREETGYQPYSHRLFLGQSYPSPNTSLEQAYHFAIEVDLNSPTKHGTDLEEVVDLALMKPADVIKLAMKGFIQDPRLELSAYLLSALVRGGPSEKMQRFSTH